MNTEMTEPVSLGYSPHHFAPCSSPSCHGRMNIDQKVYYCCRNVFCGECGTKKTCFVCSQSLNSKNKIIHLKSQQDPYDPAGRDCDALFRAFTFMLATFLLSYFLSSSVQD